MSIENDLTQYFTFSFRARHPESDLAKAVAIDELHQLLDGSPHARIKMVVSKAIEQLDPQGTTDDQVHR